MTGSSLRERLVRAYRTRVRAEDAPDSSQRGRLLGRAEFDALLSSVKADRPDTEEYQCLSLYVLDHPEAATLNRFDPFSDEYRSKVLDLYLELRGHGAEYVAARDEGGEAIPIANAFSDLPPWSFRDSKLAAEFFYAWGHVVRLLDFTPGRRASVLEYGCSSGQLLLMLARLGLETYGADIDARALDQLQEQAKAMNLSVATERAEFGQGFGHQRFDRLVFFESFHHAPDPLLLLGTLRQRLRPGGRLILCGEPVVRTAGGHVPYPWGPRLSALSVFCIRKYGWMELGFTRAYLFEAMRRTGWSVTEHPFEGCGRAAGFVARPTALPRRDPVFALAPDSKDCDWLEGWHNPEPTHRWTQGGMARVRLPKVAVGADVALRVSNLLPVRSRLTVTAGDASVVVDVDPHDQDREIFVPRAVDQVLEIACDGHRPVDIISGATDNRMLGIALVGISVEPPELDVPGP